MRVPQAFRLRAALPFRPFPLYSELRIARPHGGKTHRNSFRECVRQYKIHIPPFRGIFLLSASRALPYTCSNPLSSKAFLFHLRILTRHTVQIQSYEDAYRRTDGEEFPLSDLPRSSAAQAPET